MAEVEFYDVSKDGVEVRVEAQQNYLERGDVSNGPRMSSKVARQKIRK